MKVRDTWMICPDDMIGSWADWYEGCGWYPAGDDYEDAPDGAVIEWPDFGPGLWERCYDRWYPANAGAALAAGQ